jgi:hypothetical protein
MTVRLKKKQTDIIVGEVIKASDFNDTMEYLAGRRFVKEISAPYSIQEEDRVLVGKPTYAQNTFNNISLGGAYADGSRNFINSGQSIIGQFSSGIGRVNQSSKSYEGAYANASANGVNCIEVNHEWIFYSDYSATLKLLNRNTLGLFDWVTLPENIYAITRNRALDVIYAVGYTGKIYRIECWSGTYTLWQATALYGNTVPAVTCYNKMRTVNPHFDSYTGWDMGNGATLGNKGLICSSANNFLAQNNIVEVGKTYNFVIRVYKSAGNKLRLTNRAGINGATPANTYFVSPDLINGYTQIRGSFTASANGWLSLEAENALFSGNIFDFYVEENVAETVYLTTGGASYRVTGGTAYSMGVGIIPNVALFFDIDDQLIKYKRQINGTNYFCCFSPVTERETIVSVAQYSGGGVFVQTGVWYEGSNASPNQFSWIDYTSMIKVVTISLPSPSLAWKDKYIEITCPYAQYGGYGVFVSGTMITDYPTSTILIYLTSYGSPYGTQHRTLGFLCDGSNWIIQRK